MIVVILFVVLCNILHSDCEPSKENKVLIKFPRPIMHASSVTIGGTLNVRASTLLTKIEGREKEECVIDIKPQDNVISINGYNVTYNFFYGNKGKGRHFKTNIVPFTLNIIAMSNQDDNTTSLHVEFEGNNAGVQDLVNPCSIKSISNVDGILFEGFKHIRILTYMYNDEDGGDD